MKKTTDNNKNITVEQLVKSSMPGHYENLKSDNIYLRHKI